MSFQTFRQDPCPGDDKVADIRYRCVAASTPGIKTKTVGGACARNPCKHGGLCYLTEKGYKCDCSNIEYTGETCNIKEGKSPGGSLKFLFRNFNKKIGPFIHQILHFVRVCSLPRSTFVRSFVPSQKNMLNFVWENG